MRALILGGFLSSSLLGLAACGGSDGGSPAAPLDDGGSNLPDSGQPDGESASYPAPHLAFPLATMRRSGRLLLAPRIVTVTFPGDAMKDKLEQLGDSITQTAWWDTVREGYCLATDPSQCIGRGAGGGHVVMPDPPATNYTAQEVGAFVEAQIGTTLPAPTANTLYVFYFPKETTITDPTGASCQTFGGYHSYANLTDGTKVPYAVIPRCTYPNLTEEDTTTVGASHEIIEAATDPIPPSGFIVNDPAWGTVMSPEVADMCNFDGYVREGDVLVTRVWSNAQARQGVGPCVPVPAGEVYYNVSPGSGQDVVKLAVGESTTIDLTAFSTGPMPDWSIYAVDNNEWFQQGDPVLELSIDQRTAHNGTTAKLTITLKKAIQGQYASYSIISAPDRSSYHVWPGLVEAR